MSDSRKFLVAKRKVDRNNKPVLHTGNSTQNGVIRRGIKRPTGPAPKKNLANERLKRLRTTLHEEVQKKQLQVSTKHKQNLKNSSRIPNQRKRSSNTDTGQTYVAKVPKSNVCDTVNKSSNAFPFKTPNESELQFHFNEPTQNNIFTGRTHVDSSPASLQESLGKAEEMMEWSPADEDQTTSTVTSNEIVNSVYASPYFYIVVDTNIFISQMQMIKNIIEMNITGAKIPVIYIPWMVVEELDFIKEDPNKNSVKWKAQEAVKYIEQSFVAKNERMRGQSLEEVNQQKDAGKNPDNKIISCCLQVKEKYQNMVLLTDDVNLRNKAHINHIPVCSHKEIMQKIVTATKKQPKFQTVLDKITLLCRDVIRECALKAYGTAAHKMPIYQNVPQTIQDCIKTFTNYWFPVFQEHLLKQFKKSVEDLSSFLTKNNNITDDSKELNELVRLCVRVCIFLKDVESCKSLVESTIRQINNVKDS